MSEQTQETIIPISIEEEISTSYLNYAMSVIVSRALPDARDGLKPVHRRILYAMHDMQLTHGSQYKKTGRIVGDVLGKYHPHGDQSIYDALVRFAQDFNLRYPMIDGQGNFGSIDDDPPAAMRYTEARLTAMAEAMLQDIKKETVDFAPNYDDSMKEPSVLPAAIPFLLANGASGIAVGMATSIPPHNLREIAGAVACYIENPRCTSRDLYQHVKGPDFPTGGIIYGADTISDVYEHGRGKLCIRGRVHTETHKSGKEALIISELPYQISKNGLITRIVELSKNQKLNGIQDIRDESDREGMRIVIELKRDANSTIVLNQLYRHTPLQSNINPNMLALVKGTPKLLTLKDMIESFVLHRQEVITRRSQHDLKINEEREHILNGLIIAIENIDEVIQIIRSAKDVRAAEQNLIKRFQISERQSRAILEMRLQKLTNLETIKLEEERASVAATIKELKALLASERRIKALVGEETRALAERLGDERRTEIVAETAELLEREDLIQSEQVVFMMSKMGYVKRTPLSSYRAQSRGGRGSAASSGMEHDVVSTIISGSTTEHLFFISKIGKAYVIKMHEIPSGSRTAKGTHLRSLLTVGVEESVDEALLVSAFSASQSIIFATARGVVKRTSLDKFANVRTRGIVAIKLSARDLLMSAQISTGHQDVFLITARGLGLRIAHSSIRSMDRATRGVQGINLSESDALIAAITLQPHEEILLVTAHGQAKRLKGDALQKHNRGTKGQRVFPVSDTTGAIVAALPVHRDDNVLIASSAGNATMTAVKGIALQQKTARGVRCITLGEDEQIVAVERTPKIEK